MPHHLKHFFVDVQPQVQLCLEVFDLEEAAFIQYRPLCVSFPSPPQFDVTLVRRDRQWFEDCLPQFLCFHQEMLAAQTAAKGNPSMYTPREPIARAPRKNSALPTICLINDSLYC